MRTFFLILLISNVLISCKTAYFTVKSDAYVEFKSVLVDTLFQDKISIRAILFDANKIWFAADKGRFGFFNLEFYLECFANLS